MSKKAQELARRYGRKSDILEIAREIIEEKKRNGEIDDIALQEYRASAYPINVNTRQNPIYQYKKYPIITDDEYIQIMEWGLIPSYAKNNKEADRLRRMMVNSRAETLFDKSTYRASIKYRRCIIPSTGYFEFHYQTSKSKAQPYYIFLKTMEIFSIAGIYNTWNDPLTDNQIMTFSMITVPANPLSARIHNGGKNPFRMPLLLHKQDEENWLNPQLKEENQIKPFLQTFPDNDMDAYPISRDFLNIDPYNPAIILPLENQEKEVPIIFPQ